MKKRAQDYVTRLGQCLALAVAIIGFGSAAWWSARAAWADHWASQQTMVGLEKAARVMPGESEYYVRMAALSNDDPARAQLALRQAVALNPLDAHSWIDLGLRAEWNGDTTTAQRCLLQSASVDRTYLPRWTLANYYFRRQDSERFWFWAKQAAAMLWDDPKPLFQLCGRIAEDGQLIDRLEIRNPRIRADYLAYLLNKQREDLIGPAVERLLQDNREADVPILLLACERSIETQRSEGALQVWNRLAFAHRIPFGELNPSNVILTNGDFSVSPTSRGFDWRLPMPEGVAIAREESPPGLQFTFSGKQPEYAEVLAQFIPTKDGASYQLNSRYRTERIATETGLAWRIADLSGASLAVGKSLSADLGSEDRVVFRTPPGCRMVRIVLAYQRRAGTSRIEGLLALQKVSLDPS